MFNEPPPANFQAEANKQAPPPSKLSAILVTNIWIISIVGFASILLLAFGDFDGKIERVITTLLLFAAFSLFSSISFNGSNSPLSPYINQAGNIYMLVLGLILIWGSLGSEVFAGEIFTFALSIILLVKAGVLAAQYVALMTHAPQPLLSKFAVLSTGAFAALTILLTLPLGFVGATFGEWYWKLVVAVVLFGGLTISVMSLLVWNFRKATSEAEVQASPSYYTGPTNAPPLHAYPNAPTNPVQQPQQAFQQQYAPSQPQFTQPQETSEQQQKTTAPPSAQPATQHQPTPQAQPNPHALAWPVFPNGQPLPATPDGQPDYQALMMVLRSYENMTPQTFPGNTA